MYKQLYYTRNLLSPFLLNSAEDRAVYFSSVTWMFIIPYGYLTVLAFHGALELEDTPSAPDQRLAPASYLNSHAFG